MNKPFVSVVMTVFNGQDYVGESIKSILSQTYIDFEFIIIDDGSSDSSPQFISSVKDSRIRFYRCEENLGVIHQLNYAFSLATGKYIIKMDQDDISLFNRIESQVEFMENNPAIGVSGSYVRLFGADHGLWKMPTVDADIKSALISGSPFCHSSVIFRKSLLVQHKMVYRLGFDLTDDYDLWTQLAKVTQFANLNKCLLHYRISNNQVSILKLDEQLKQKSLIRKRVLDEVFEITVKYFNEIFVNDNGISNYSKLELQMRLEIVGRISVENKKKGLYDIPAFDRELGFYILRLIVTNKKFWFSNLLWIYRNKFYLGWNLRMYFGLIKRILVQNIAN
jgi:glycosyltransferase involved in cell wall biosynthesis